MDKLRICLIVLFIAFLCLTCIWLAGCDDDNPVKSPLVVAPQYPFYFRDVVDLVNYQYLPYDDSLRTFELPEQARLTAVSADGTRLFATTETETLVIHWLSLGVIARLPYHLPYDGAIAASPDGSMLAICTDDLYILDASTYDVLYHDTLKLCNGQFSADSRSFYGCRWESPYGYLHRFRCDSSFAMTFWHTGAWIHRFVPSPDETRFYIINRYSYSTCEDIFSIYDIVGDSMLYEQLLPSGMGLGDLALSPDGRYAFFSNPGAYIIDPGCPPPDSFITVFDTETFNVCDRICTKAVYGDNTEVDSFSLAREIVISPDGKWLMSVSWLNTFVVANIENGVGTVRYKALGSEPLLHEFDNLLTQSGL